MKPAEERMIDQWKFIGKRIMVGFVLGIVWKEVIHRPPKSVGAEVNWGVRFENSSQGAEKCKKFILDIGGYLLCFCGSLFLIELF